MRWGEGRGDGAEPAPTSRTALTDDVQAGGVGRRRVVHVRPDVVLIATSAGAVRRGTVGTSMESDDQTAGVAQVERLLRTIRADPGAPRLVAVTGPGGSGKSLALRSLRTLYARDADGAAGPLIVDDVHVLGEDAVREIVDAATVPGAQVTVAFRPWPVERGLGELRLLIGEHGTTVSLDPFQPRAPP